MQNSTVIALSRLVAQQRAIDVSATNIANAGTPGYRAERVMFSDWLMQTRGTGLAPGTRTLVFAQDRATYRDTQPGPLTHTANPLDLAIGSADGFFTVQTPRGARLTRAGHFELSSTGAIVDSQGDALLDANGRPLQVAAADTQLTISANGTLASENGVIGRIGVVKPDDANKLSAEGGRLLSADTPTTAITAPKVIQGALEGSNIQPTIELTRMMGDMREFQFVTQLVQGEADRQQAAIDKITQKR